MYFSRVRVSPVYLQQFAKLFQYNHYQLHQLLWKLFQDKPDDKRDFLFRQDSDRQGLPVFYLISKTLPNKTDPSFMIESKPYHPHLRIGDTLAFNLRANPVVQISHPRTSEEEAVLREQRRAKGLREKDILPQKRVHHDVVMHLKKSLGEEEKRLYSQADLEQKAGEKWLQERADKNGFRLLSVTAQGYQQHHFKKRQIKISTLDYYGVLQITDPELFVTKALFQGIGRSKAFGCGLMLIRRI